MGRSPNYCGGGGKFWSFYLFSHQKKCTNGFSFIAGGILAASVKPPVPGTTVGGAMCDQNEEEPQPEMVTAPPSYDSLV